MDCVKISKEIIDAVGGSKNITSTVHCATRLRLSLVDESLINEDILTDIEGVKGTFNAKGQYQIIIGPGLVNRVCEEMNKQLDGQINEIRKEKEDKKGNIIQRGIKLLSDIFVPIIPAIVAGGLLMGINNILTAQGIFIESKSVIEAYPQFADLASMINMFSNAGFTFLPILIGFSATKKFGGNPYLGAVLGMIMVHPDLLNAYNYGQAGIDIPVWNLFGLTIEAVGYQGTVLPVLAVSWILATIEKKLHKITPIWLDNLTTPLLSTVITSFVTFLFVGPILRDAGVLLANGMTWIYNSLGFVGGGILGLLYAPICLTGMHQSFIAVETQLLASASSTGGTFIFPTASMSNVAQGSAVIAVLLLTKNQKLKSICSASGISALLGITEPAMFGVTLKLRYPFYAAMVGSAVGSAYLAGTNTLAIALGAAGLPGFISIRPENWGNFAIGIILSVATSFILTVILFKRQCMKEISETNKKEEMDIKEEIAVTKGDIEETEDEILISPMSGEIKSVTQSPDETFAAKIMGDGIVIFPTDGKIVSPCDGKITFAFPTKHAFGLTSIEGTEILVHCGIDTLKLEGKGFKSHISEGQNVKKGDLLLEADLDFISKSGYSIATPCIITNGKKFDFDEGNYKFGDEIIKVKC